MKHYVEVAPMFTWWTRMRAAGGAREAQVETEMPSPAKVEKLLSRLDDQAEAAVSLVPTIPVDTPARPISSSTCVIAIAAQKRGAGKTTIAAHLAVHALKTGQGAVVLADTDPQVAVPHWCHA